MRGIGRFDQRGSISDALKQGALTYGGGQAVRILGGAGFQKGLGVPGDRFTTPLSDKRSQAIKGLFENAAIDFPTFKPTVKQTTKPGPAVAATPSISLIENLLSLRAVFIMYSIFSR